MEKNNKYMNGEKFSMKKRIMSIVLVFCIMFTMLPSNVFAAETGDTDEPNAGELLASVTGDFLASVSTSDGTVNNFTDFATALSAAQGSTGSTLKLLSDVSYSGETEVINIISTMTLDLNGWSLTMSGNRGFIQLYNDNANLTVQDNSIGGNGKIISSADYVIGVWAGTLMITGGFYKTIKVEGITRTISQDGENSKVEITGGEFKNAGGYYSVAYNKGSMSISGGIFDNDIEVWEKNIAFSGGTYKSKICVYNDSVKLNDLLADNYCYYDSDSLRYIPEAGTNVINEPVTVDEMDWSKAVTYNENAKTYTVSSAEGLRWISGVNNYTIEKDTYKNDPVLPETSLFTGYTIKLNADIDLSSKNWIPINEFKGTFDGAGHSIFNMTVVENGSGGLIKYLSSGASVRNLCVSGTVTVNNVSDVEEPVASYAGGIAAQVNSSGIATTSIENCVTNVTVIVNGIVDTVSLGGIVGSIESSSGNATVSLHNCYSGGTVTNNATVIKYLQGPYIGALVGDTIILSGNTGALTNCYASQSGINMVGHVYVDAAAAIHPVLTSVGTYDAAGTLTATDGTSLTYGNDLKTAMKNGVLRQCADAVKYVTWTTDAIPKLTTTYATVHTHQIGEWTKQADGSYTSICTECGEKITAEACVISENTETSYGTLEEAITAAQSEDGITVKLLTDVTTENTVTVSSGTFTIDLNGRTWNSVLKSKGDYGLELCSDSNVTLKDSVGTGVFTSTGDTISVMCVPVTIVSGTYCSTVDANVLFAIGVTGEGQRVTINGGTFENSTVSNSPVNIWSSNVTINGGAFLGESGIYFSNCRDVDITGGTFASIITSTSEDGTIKTVGGLLGDGYAYSKKSDGTWISDISSNHLKDIIVTKAPVKITDQPQNTAVTYGYTDAPVLSMTAQKAEGVTSDITYQWHLVNSSTVVSTNSTCQVESGLGAGIYSYICDVTCDGYTLGSSTATVTVNQLTGSITNKDYPSTFIYTNADIAKPIADNFTFNVPEENLVYTWYSGESTDDSHKISGLPKDVGTYTLKVTAQEIANITAAEYTMKVDIKYLETDDVPNVFIKDQHVKKDWYNKSDFNDYVYLNAVQFGYSIRLDANDCFYNDMYINDIIKDSNGNIKEGQVEVKYQLNDNHTNQKTDFKSYFFNIDVTEPTIDESNIKYSEHQSFLDWLFHNAGIQVTVPVSDAVSGADHISYVLTPEGGTAQEAQTAIVGADGNAVFMVEKDFKGTIAVTAYDKAGNPSEAVDINKMCVEDTKPTVTVNDGTNAFTDQWYTNYTDNTY